MDGKIEKNYLMLAIKGYLANYTGLPRSCWLRVIARCISATAGSMSFFLSLYFVSVLHIPLVMAGVIIACYGIGTTAGGIISGILADRISPRVISISGLLIQGFSFLLFLILRNPYLLMVVEFVSGMAAYSFITANSLLTLNHAKQTEADKRKTIHVLYTASNLGIGLGAAIVGIFAVYGFHYLFIWSAILLFLAALYLMIWEKPVELIADVKSNQLEATLIQPQPNKKMQWLILSCVFLNGLTLAQLSSTFTIYLATRFPQMGASAASYLFILNTALIVFLQTPLGGFLKNNNKIMIAGLGALLIGLGMMLLSFAWVFGIAILSTIIYTLGEMLFIPMMQLICYQNGAAKKKGQSIGMYQTIYALSVVIGPIMGAYIYHHFGSRSIWYGSGLIGVVCFGLCFLYNKRSPY